jgi:Isoleucyl-tRNA synthetase
LRKDTKKIKKNKNDVLIIEFRKECRDLTSKWVKIHKDQFKKIRSNWRLGKLLLNYEL